MPAEELANESRSTHITVAADMVFSLSHYLSGVSLHFSLSCIHDDVDLDVDRNRRLRPCLVRCFVGGNPVVGPLAASSAVQLAEAGRDLVLQHEPYPFGVVEHVGNPRGALQSGSSIHGPDTAYNLTTHRRSAAIKTPMWASLLSMLFGSWQCASWRRRS